MPSPKQSAVTLAQVIAIVDQHSALTNAQKTELRSAVSRFAAISRRRLDEVIADPAVIRPLIAAAPWQLSGLSKRAWNNLRYRLGRAMQLAGVRVDRRRRNFKLADNWARLLERLPERPRQDLRRFAGWCSTLGIMPEEVVAEVHERFTQYVLEQSLQRRPRERAHVARRAWNNSVAIDGSTYSRIPDPDPQGHRYLRWEDLPASLRADFERYARAVTKVSVFRNRRKLLRPITLVGYRKQLTWFASRLVETGVSIETLTSLKELVRTDYFERGLEAQLGQRRLDEATASLHAMATALLSVASFVEVPSDQLQELRRLAREVRHEPVGMCSKVVERLAQFEDTEMVSRLFCLPIAVAERFNNVTRPTLSQAADMQLACLTEILLHVPLRIRNAAELDLGRSIIRPVTTGGRWRIAIAASDVKNEQSIDAELPEDSSAMLARYVDVFRPVLSDVPSTALFVSKNGVTKDPKHLSNQFALFVRRETGLVVHSHMMRHFFAYQYLSEFPGEYEVVRRALRHKQINTTLKFYSGLETKNDLARYDQMIARRRDRK